MAKIKKKKTFNIRIEFLSYSIIDGSEFIMKIHEYIDAADEQKACVKLKKIFKASEYYARIESRITDIYVHEDKLDCKPKHIYHSNYPQPSLFDFNREF